ncbi:MAG TPA: ABC transporter ATP-binding protein [Acidimicrobiales bacterium]
MDDAMLEIRGASVSYGAVRAVSDLDLTVGAGEVVAVLGANGAGKTTTLRAITALVPYAGSIRFDGDEVSAVGTEELARRGLIHVPEGRHIFGSLSVHENLLMGLPARAGRTGGYTVDDVYDLFPPLVALRNRSGWALSGGEQQMVAVGRALVAAPRLLLLDEPSLGLAPIVVAAVYRALREVAKTTPMLVVEQNTGAVLDLCDRGVVLADGRQVVEGTAAELGGRRDLLDSYLGQRVLDEAEA